MPAIQQGTRLGGYRLLERIGRGGVGTVWLAEHEAMQTAVAIKVLNGDGGGADGRERFMREASAAFRLQHPNIVRVLHADVTPDGDVWMVMDLVQGPVLKGYVPEGGLPPAEAIQLLTGIGDGLAYAHHNGVLHRDIKPENILIRASDSTPLISDFGLTRLVHSDSDLTHTGGVLGTPGYMSPEQWESSSQVDQRADVWSFGITAWFMLCGQAPYAGLTPPQVLRQIVRCERPSLHDMNPGLDPKLVRVVEKMVAWRAERRFQSVDEALQVLARFSSGSAWRTARKSGQSVLASGPDAPVPAGLQSGERFHDAAPEVMSINASQVEILSRPEQAAPGVGAAGTRRMKKRRRRRPDDGAPRASGDSHAGADNTDDELPEPAEPTNWFRQNAFALSTGLAISAVLMVVMLIVVRLSGGPDQGDSGANDAAANNTVMPTIIARDTLPDLRTPPSNATGNAPSWEPPANVNTPPRNAAGNADPPPRNNSATPSPPDPPRNQNRPPGENRPANSQTPEQQIASAEPFVERSLSALDNGNTRDAIWLATEALSRAPHYYRGFLARAKAYYAADRLVDAERDATEALRLNPTEPAIRFTRGLARYGQSNFTGAAIDLEEVVRLQPDYGSGWGLLAMINDRLGRPDKAIADYGRAIRLEPGRGVWYAYRARVLASQKQQGAAVDDYGKAIELRPEAEADYRRERSELLIALGRHAEALRDLDRLVDIHFDDGKAWAIRATVLAMLGDFVTAEQSLINARLYLGPTTDERELLRRATADVERLRREATEAARQPERLPDAVGDPPMSEAAILQLLQRSRLTNAQMVQLVDVWCHPGCPAEWRPETVRVLGEQPDGRSASILRAALRDLKPDDARKVCVLVARLKHDDAASILGDALESGDAALRASAIRSLGATGTRSSLGALCRLWRKLPRDSEDYPVAFLQLTIHARDMDLEDVRDQVVPAIAIEAMHADASLLAARSLGLPDNTSAVVLNGWWEDISRTWRDQERKESLGGAPINVDDIVCSPPGTPRGPNLLLAGNDEATAMCNLAPRWQFIDHTAVLRFQAIRGDLVASYETNKVRIVARVADGNVVFHASGDTITIPLKDGWNTLTVRVMPDDRNGAAARIEFNKQRVFGFLVGFDGVPLRLQVQLPSGGIAAVGQWEILTN